MTLGCHHEENCQGNKTKSSYDPISLVRSDHMTHLCSHSKWQNSVTKERFCLKTHFFPSILGCRHL